MKVRKVVRKRLQSQSAGISVAGDVQAVVVANVDEPGAASARVSSRQRIVQRSARRAGQSTNREENG